MEEIVSVEVSFSREVTYRKTIEMSRSQYDAINARLDAAEAERGDAIRRAHEELFEELGFDAGDGDYTDPEMDDFYCESEAV